MSGAKVIPLKRRHRAPALEGPARISNGAYANPAIGVAMQVDLTARIVHVIVGRAEDPVELAWTPADCRRIARQLFRLADDVDGVHR